MWVTIAVFGGSLAGLIALFGFKYFEDKVGRETPLATLRRSCDPLIEEGCTKYLDGTRTRMKKLAEEGCYAARRWFREEYFRFLSVFHRAVVRLHVYLSRRRAIVSRNRESVSPHLKNMLEYKEQMSQSSREHSEKKI